MRTYYLEPIDEQLDDEAWSASKLKEGCWILADSEDDARHQVELIALNFVDREEGKPTPYSPWRDPKLTSCTEAEAPFNVPERVLVTDGGKTYS